MKALIVDNNKDCRELLIKLISENCPAIRETAEAKTVPKAIKKIKSFLPDIIFLEVNIGKQTCFDILNEYDAIQAQIVLISDTDKYTLKAFDYGAVHYLLKPVLIHQLVVAVERCIKLISQNTPRKVDKSKAFYLNTTQQSYVIQYEDIAYIEADGSYSTIYYHNGNDIYTSKKLGHYDSILPEQFLRIHHSIIVNVNRIKEVNSQKSMVVLTNNTALPVSRRRKPALKSLL